MSIFDEAKRLTALGFSVIPVKLNWNEVEQKFEKKPIATWSEYQKRQPTKEELEKWFNNDTTTALGIVTGEISKIIVVDVESADLEQIIKDFKLSSGRVASTISGGKHFYFKRTEPIRNTVRVEGRAFDIRGDGGFVVAPPSYCIKDGKRFEYKWEQDAPSMFLNELPLNIKKNLGFKEVSGSLQISEHIGIEKGSRNDNLYKVACSLLNRSNPEDAWITVCEINKTYSPPLHERELKTLFNSAINFLGIANDTYSEEKSNTSLLMGRPLKWNEIVETEGKREWLWENFIAKRSKVLFSALPKIGKTTLLRSLFVAMHKNEEFAGQPTTKCRVLVLSEEDVTEWYDNREGVSDEDIEDVFVWPLPLRGIPSRKDWVQIVKEISLKCIELQIDLVVLDTISSFWPVEDENDAAGVKRALVPLAAITQESKAAILIVHHFKKEGGKDGTAARGSGALAGDVDNLIEFRKNEDGTPNQRKLKTFGRGVSETEVVIEMKDDGTYETKGEPWIVSKNARLQKILDIMALTNRPMTVEDVLTYWTLQIGKVSKRTIRRYLEDLCVSGTVSVTNKEAVTNRNPATYARTGWISTP